MTIAATLDPAVVAGHADSLREAVSNVLVNAIQYNVPGGRVTVSLQRGTDGVTLTIADTGAGIAPEDVDRVFHPFFRADPARRRDPGGAGLGLAITDAIVRAPADRRAARAGSERARRLTIRLPPAWVTGYGFRYQVPGGRFAPTFL